MSVLVTHLAPDFTKPAVLPDGTFNDAFNFHTEISGKYAVLFFYPLDFTFVCPSEILAHSHRAEEFRKRNAYKRRRFPSRKPGRCMSRDSSFSVPLQDGVGRAFEHAKPVRGRGSA